MEEYYSYVVSLFDEGKYEDSIQYFQYCLDLAPDYSQAYQYLGNAYYNLERYDEAIPCFEKVLEFNPEDENLRQWLNEFKTSLQNIFHNQTYAKTNISPFTSVY